MTTVTAATTATTAATAAEVLPEATEDAATALTADFETFLQLLTTQLENQDPQEPLDSTEFVAQLASFSAVEQQINTNTKLDQLISTMTQDQTGSMASWIGTSVKSDAPVDFDGAPVDVFFAMPQTATRGDIVVRSSTGAIINRIPVQPGETQLNWDGKGSDGLTAATGSYSFGLESFEGKAPLGETPAQTFSNVVEVRSASAGVDLVFADGSVLNTENVSAVR